MKLHLLPLLGLATLAVLFSVSCATPLALTPDPAVPRYGYPEGKAPTFYMLYHPYGQSGGRKLGSPMLDYAKGSWTDQRMERDLERISGTGVDGILCVVELEDAGQESVRERLGTFAGKAMAAGRSFRLAFMLDAPAGVPSAKVTAAASSFASYLLASGIPDRDLYLQTKESESSRLKPAVLLSPNASYAFTRHPGVAFLRTGGPAAAWIVDPGLQTAPVLNRDRTQAVVPAATFDPETQSWLLPQNDGQTLAEALKATVAAHPEVIVFASWNDYSAGRFIEPSWNDRGATLERLKREMALFRQNLATPAAPTAP